MSCVFGSMSCILWSYLLWSRSRILRLVVLFIASPSTALCLRVDVSFVCQVATAESGTFEGGSQGVQLVESSGSVLTVVVLVCMVSMVLAELELELAHGGV